MPKRISKKTIQQIESILQKPYSKVFIKDEEKGWFSASILEFNGCFAEGEEIEDAYENLENAAESWLLSCIETGKEIPEPFVQYEAGGKLLLRLPRNLHARLKQIAATEGVSVNTIICSFLAERLGGQYDEQGADN